MTEFIERTSVRAILLTPSQQVLLLRIRPPDGREPFWLTPGGGVESGEGTEDCLRRELREEVGLERFTIGPLLWRREHTFTWAGKRLRQGELYHVVHVDEFTPVMTDPTEAIHLDQFRWWSLPDLTVAKEHVVPHLLAKIIEDYLVHGPPRGPLEVETLID